MWDNFHGSLEAKNSIALRDTHLFIASFVYGTTDNQFWLFVIWHGTAPRLGVGGC